MENQNPPPFPFDAFDASFGVGDEFGPPDLFPLSPPAATNERQDALRAVHRKLQELDDQLRSILKDLERALQGEALPVGSVRAVRGGTEVHAFEPSRPMPRPRPVDPLTSSLQKEDDANMRVIEGVFDGQNMVGPDGKQYSVPANYASKSKLVEGDILKLRITPRGAFVYKQIGPIARERRIGVLERDDVTGEFVVIVPDAEADRSAMTRAVVEGSSLPTSDYKRYRTLRASVTYYRGEPGDEVVVLVPKDAPSTWAAVDNVIKR